MSDKVDEKTRIFVNYAFALIKSISQGKEVATMTDEEVDAYNELLARQQEETQREAEDLLIED